ncbi:FKBP-type peptidyl-prolyl cis-trans isomerase [Salmonella enterica subsp. enterica serovar Amager]|nr:FKBP-type peptidyl-prolyl cis-trans isomerase [Salmonella enterica subsp. enterica serovar Amager]
MRGVFSVLTARKSPLAFLITLMLLSSPVVDAAGVTGYTSSDDLPEDAAALPPAPAERPWLHHRASRENPAHKEAPLVPAALLPQLQALQSRMNALEQALSERDGTVTDLKTQLAGHNNDTMSLQQQIAGLKTQLAERDGVVADLKTQLAERDGTVADLKTQLAESSSGTTDLQAQLTALKSRLATEKEARAEQTEKLLALRRQNPDVSLETEGQQQAYASGVAFAGVVARSLQMQKSLGVAPQQDTVLAGIVDGVRHQVRLNSEQIKTRNQELDSKLNGLLAERREQQEKARNAQQKAGEAWQASYRKVRGVRAMKNGVLYRVLSAGKGRQIQEGDTVELLLSGYLVDGKAFDDSGEKGRVQRVKPSDLLPALTGVLTALRAGSHVEVLLPPAQAFGDDGVKGMIPGGATLRFDIRVLKASAGGETKAD